MHVSVHAHALAFVIVSKQCKMILHFTTYLYNTGGEDKKAGSGAGADFKPTFVSLTCIVFVWVLIIKGPSLQLSKAPPPSQYAQQSV